MLIYARRAHIDFFDGDENNFRTRRDNELKFSPYIEHMAVSVLNRENLDI